MNRLLWLVPLFLLVHNIEEALTAPHFLDVANRLATELLTRSLFPVSYSQFLFALAIVTSLPFFFAAMAQVPATAIVGRHLVLLIQAVAFVNVFSHLAMAVILRGYVPGLVSAVCLNLPFSIFLGRVAFRSDWLRPGGLVLLVILALVIHTVGLFGLMLLARYVARGL